MCIKLHEAHRLALPAAKQKEEEEEEVPEPCGLDLFDGSQMPRLCEALCEAQCSAFKSSLKLEMPLKCILSLIHI